MNAQLTTRERLQAALEALEILRDEVHLRALRSGAPAMAQFMEIDVELRRMLVRGWPTGSMIEAFAQKLRDLGSVLHA